MEKPVNIKVSKKKEKKIREILKDGGLVWIGRMGWLYVKHVPERKAYHNFSDKKITIAGYDKVVFVESKM